MKYTFVPAMVFLQNSRNKIASLSLACINKDRSASKSVNGDKIITQSSADYEPYDFGNNDNPLQRYGALFHLMKYIVGTGILTLPYAFKNVGYAVGIIGTLVVGLVYTHVIHLLLEVEYELCKRLRTPNLTYIGVVEQTFKTGPKEVRKAGPYCVFFMYYDYVVNGALGNAGYLLIMGENLKDIYDGNYGENSDIKYFITALAVFLMVLCWIPRLRFLIPFSVMTSVFTLLNVGIIILISVHPSSGIGQPKPVNDIFFFPQFFGLVLSAVSATGLVLPVKNDMGNPKIFGSSTGVLNVSLLITTIAYGAFGVLGYLKYGDNTKGNVLSNLPEGQLLSVLVYFMYTLAVCVSFTLSFYIIFDTIWSNGLGNKMSSNSILEFFVKFGLKTLVNVFTYIVAIAIPDFELFASLMGTIGILSGIGIPPTLHIILLLSTSDRPKNLFVIIVKDFIIIFVALFLFVTGCISSVGEIVSFYNT